MLVLSRKKDEKVIITANGIQIDVMVVEIRGDNVRLAFLAPKDVVIHRQEVLIAIQRAQQKDGSDGDGKPN